VTHIKRLGNKKMTLRYKILNVKKQDFLLLFVGFDTFLKVLVNVNKKISSALLKTCKFQICNKNFFIYFLCMSHEIITGVYLTIGPKMHQWRKYC
jgi:hypothetical protein